MFEILEEDTMEYKINKKISEIGELPIIIFGAGENGCHILNLLEDKGLSNQVIAIFDNDFSKIGKRLNRRSVCVSSPINNEEFKEALIIIGTMYREKVLLQLRGLGFHKFEIEFLYLARCYSEYKDEPAISIVKKHKSDFEEIYSFLEDGISKRVYSNILKAKVFTNNKYLIESYSLSNQYFENDLIQLIDEEVFVDCGSYDGDTYKVFQQITDGKYKEYIAIEADPNIYQKLLKTVGDNHKVKCIEKACWDKNEDLRFSSSQTSSHVNSEGSIIIQGETLDFILAGIKPTFIKMDIEGAEYKALLGAQNIIKDNLPILAVCIYHSLEEHFILPKLIKKISANYKIYVRHYTREQNLETVCYAIPPHRMKR